VTVSSVKNVVFLFLWVKVCPVGSKTFWIRLLIPAACLAYCHPATARIGDTLSQVLSRYGHCLKTVTAENGMVYRLFSRNGFKILIHFYENTVDEISYDKGSDIFDDELKALLQENAPGLWVGSGWPSNRWHNASGISAHYSFEHRVLTIMTDAALERGKKMDGTRLSSSEPGARI
jgi:hypothetical protein